MSKKEVKFGVVLFALAAIWCLAGFCLAEVTIDGRIGSSPPVPKQLEYTSEVPVDVSAGETIIVNFDDLPIVTTYGLLPSMYAGLDWDCYYDGDPDYWGWKSEPGDPGYSEPHSGINYIFNGYGVKNLGFSLPNADDCLTGAWFAKTTATTTPSAVRFKGYNASHTLVQQSPWLMLSSVPQYLAANFPPVARIEVEHSSSSAAWYTMDDLTYQPICEPPAEPANPDPCDDAIDVPVDTNLAWGEACSPHCQVENGGFETGGFALWTAVTGPGEELTPWNVSTGGTGWFGNGVPFEGSYFAQNGFDGQAGLYYELYQEVEIPECAATATLSWAERIQWDMFTFPGSTLPREYVVSVQPAGGGAPLAVMFTMNLEPGTLGDTGYVSHSVDLVAANPDIAGQNVRISFYEYIPEYATGPAQFDLDGISLTCTATKSLPNSAEFRAALLNKYHRFVTATQDSSGQTEDPESQVPNTTSAQTGDTGINPADVSISNAGSLIGIDFDAGSGSPANWNYTTGGSSPIIMNNLVREDGTISSVSATLASAGAGFDNYVTSANPSTVPMHTPSLIALGDYFWYSSHLPWTFTFSNLVAGEPYDVYVFGLRGFEMNNDVTILGGSPSIHFIQSDTISGRLWVNSEIGSSTRELESFAEVMTADALGKIVITVRNITNSQTIAGIAIEPVDGTPPPPALTWDVYFGTNPNSLELICQDINEPLCDPTPGPGQTLDCATWYYWQVVSKNDCNEVEGDIWSFRTVGNPPDCSGAFASVCEIWPPNHKWVDIEILGVVDPDDDPVTITITDITQDEPVIDMGSGNTAPDAEGVGMSKARVRAERSGLGNGRVYEISFDADDGKGGLCSGSVKICVPHESGTKNGCIDDGQLYDSTATNLLGADLNHDGVINQIDFAMFAGNWLTTYELDY